jgi:methylenetetrahydrofolate reductase (NADPH)
LSGDALKSAINGMIMTTQSQVTISFEFFPPKTPEGWQHFLAAAHELATVQPAFFSVTFGAGGSTREGTLLAVKMLQQSTAIPVTPHRACIGANRAQMIDIIELYRSLGLTRIVALRGDLPVGESENTGDLPYASDLVALIREIAGNHFHIEVAAYPEFHPQAVSANQDVANLKTKIAAGANSAITQYFFNPDAYFYFMEQCAREGIFVPVTPGIMPITQLAKLARFSAMCGAEIPRWIVKRLEAYGDDQESVQAFGLEVVYDLCERLLAGGAPGLHFYTLNHATASLALLKMLNIPRFNSADKISTEKSAHLLLNE